MNSRQLLMPSASDSIAVTDDLDRQINWAKSRNCTYLLQTNLTRLGETVQVGAYLMDLNKNPIFRRAYRASSPDDLHPVFGQLGNSLQDPKFAAVESIYDVTSADAKRLTKKKSSTYYSLSVGGSYFKDFEDLFGIGLGYFWDNRTFMGEIVWNMGFSEYNFLNEFGLRVYYPFTDKNSTVYIGGGAGYGASYLDSYCDDDTCYREKSNSGLVVECAVGYLMGRTSNLLFRAEASGKALISEKSIGAGLRIILGIGD